MLTDSRTDAALSYASLGYPVFPLKPHDKVPLTEHGLKDATLDATRIAAWWSAHPSANIGLRTNGLLVIDVDGAANPWLTAEREAELIGAAQATTPRGGRHFVFRAPDGTDFRNSAGRLAPKVDVRANGGYIAVAPSDVNGAAYRWTEELPERDRLPEPPAEILAALRAPPLRITPVEPPAAETADNLSRNTLLFLQFGAEEGTRNDRLFKAACDMAGNGIERGKAERALTPPALRCGMDQREIEKSIGSAYSTIRTPARGVELTPEKIAETFGALPTPTEENSTLPPAKRIDRQRLANVSVSWVRTADGNNAQVVKYRPIDEVSDSCIDLCAGWPKSCSGLLFVENGRGGVRYLSKTPDLFSWLARRADIHWKQRGEARDKDGMPATPVTKEEFHSHLKETVPERYRSVSELPHEPPIPGVYYLPCDLPPPTGKALATFLDALNPETPEDKQLLLAAILTPMWGGPCGGRPAFLLSSQHGRGSGKTSTANAIADIYGGAFRVQHKETWEQIGKRLLGDRALALRVLIRDNVKGKVAAEEMESFITDPEISGWRPFFGDFSRPNYMNCIFTANAPRLGADMADRAVEIHIGDRRHGKPFQSWYRDFLRDHGLALLSDIRARLQEPARGVIPPELVDRWSEWQVAILCRCDNPAALARLIRDRREETDTDTEEAEEVATAIQAFCDEKALPLTQDGLIRLTRDQMREVLCNVGLIDKNDSKRFAHAIVSNMLGSHGPLAGLRDSRRADRCWLWTPASGSIPI